MKPSSLVFKEDFSQKCWVEDFLRKGAIQVVDANLLKPEVEHLNKKLERQKKFLTTM